VILWIAIPFLNGTKCENDARTFIVNLIFILAEIHKNRNGTHCWLKTKVCFCSQREHKRNEDYVIVSRACIPINKNNYCPYLERLRVGIRGKG
jgi:hypothetical protein